MTLKLEYDNCGWCGDTIQRRVPNFGREAFNWRHIGNNRQRCSNGVNFAQPAARVFNE